MNGCGERGGRKKQKVDNDGSEVAVEMILAHRERVVGQVTIKWWAVQPCGLFFFFCAA